MKDEPQVKGKGKGKDGKHKSIDKKDPLPPSGAGAVILDYLLSVRDGDLPPAVVKMAHTLPDEELEAYLLSVCGIVVKGKAQGKANGKSAGKGNQDKVVGNGKSSKGTKKTR